MIINNYTLLEYDNDIWEPNYIDMSKVKDVPTKYPSIKQSERQQIIAQYDTVNKSSKYFGYGDIRDAYKNGTALMGVRSYIKVYDDYFLGKAVEPKILLSLGASAMRGFPLDIKLKKRLEQAQQHNKTALIKTFTKQDNNDTKKVVTPPNVNIKKAGNALVGLFLFWAIITFFAIKSVVRGYIKFKDAKSYIKNVRYYYKGYKLFMRDPDKYQHLAQKLERLGYTYHDGMAIIAISQQIPSGNIYDIAIKEYNSYLRNPKIRQAKQKEL